MSWNKHGLDDQQMTFIFGDAPLEHEVFACKDLREDDRVMVAVGNLYHSIARDVVLYVLDLLVCQDEPVVLSRSQAGMCSERRHRDGCQGQGRL